MFFLDIGFWILDFGFWILDFGFWILASGFGLWCLFDTMSAGLMCLLGPYVYI
jgi:hypothetical protein